LQKINIYIFILLIVIISGCSGIRKISGNKVPETSTYFSLDSLSGHNLTAENFYIQKAELSVNTDFGRQKLATTIKFNYPDKYLVSLRIWTGMEVVRAYITGDTVLVNDRLNRVTYYGKPEKLAAKFGVPVEILPVVLGDYVSGLTLSKNDRINCTNGSSGISSVVKGSKVNYYIDCEKGKLVRAEREGNTGSVVNEISFGNFITAGNFLTPSEIEIKDMKSGEVAGLKIDKIIKPWDGSVEFIPGSNYDLIELK
jgi:hypothetical protein